MADDPTSYQRDKIPLFCDAGDVLCRLPWGYLRSDGVLEVRSTHHGKPHTNLTTLNDLAARLGLRLVPAQVQGAAAPSLADAAAALGLRLVPLTGD